MGPASLKKLSPQVRQYLVITGNYWAFTLTDGALRMLVVLYFHQLGYSPLNIALLFLFYEIFGVVTNLLGGWLGARLGRPGQPQAARFRVGEGLNYHFAISSFILPSSTSRNCWVVHQP